MKNWKNAEIVELNINETAQGGKDSTRVDGMWTDKNTGNAWASFASGGNAGGLGLSFYVFSSSFRCSSHKITA